MSTRPPASRGTFTVRISAYDGACALVMPLVALWVRDAQALSAANWITAAGYCAVSASLTLIALVAFRIRDRVAHLFSVGDALELGKAIAISELTTCLIVFSATRLDGIPRTTPLIHALLLSGALVASRAYARMRRPAIERAPGRAVGSPEHILVIGADRLSSLYIGFLRAYSPARCRVIGVLDDRPEMLGRTLAGMRVLGPVSHLLPIVEEFKEHGITTERILVSTPPERLSADSLAQIARVASVLELRVDYIPQLLGLESAEAMPPRLSIVSDTAGPSAAASYTPPRYHRIKRTFELILSLVLTVAIAPVMLIVAGIVLIDVGTPVLFWQQRIGRNGESFQLHKFRTLKPSFDGRGQPLPESARLSSVGRILRLLRLDELPQLLNVLVGDMSLIGPRPLLPRDQPPNPMVRLSVRPGITGWAQVHGGTLLTPEEKNVLDEWYVRNASPLIDLLILGKTFAIVLGGERHAAPRPAGRKLGGFEIHERRRSLSGT